ncbi:MAG: LEPR-XLL domain-containing protein [Fibrobacteraceae bacterium]|nr:LEPR-XLL domain-containing protein [Fibrobacteraceae bacterium]
MSERQEYKPFQNEQLEPRLMMDATVSD